ncbi:transaldolase [Streptomyces sp. NPDC048362]|uniref:transaldolase n=1 Tax=Streptomyces sp. NPDC048362 TaxID=3365539 RepID=UPI003718C6EC
MPVSPSTDPLAELSAAGVSVWLDDLSRELLVGGRLKELIADKHVVGVTTNPTIFASALSKGDRYVDQLSRLETQGADVDDAVLALTTDDVREGCRAFRDVYRSSGSVDGRVSIEVDPRVARDAEATFTQAVKLWETVGEPNLFVKIPATGEGLAAITAATARGISVNVTLIFSLDRYRKVMDAYQTGLEQALEAGLDLSGIHSVASFFVSRVDTEVDRRLDALDSPQARELKGKAAIANARLAYRAYEQVVAEARWQRLAAAGANVQRPLWASTGVKNPDYPDTMYVSDLVIAGTVNTMPGTTLTAFADHGTVPGHAPTAEDYAAAAAHLASLTEAGVDFADVTDTLEREGLEKFEASWAELGASVAGGMRSATGPTARPADGGSSGSSGSNSVGLLAIYLNDHYAGATGGLELFQRAAGARKDKEEKAVLTDLVRQVEEDRDALAQIMADLDVSVDRSKAALGWVVEKAGRLKTNGHLFSRSPLSDVLETEAMLTGVLAKAAAWRTLRALAGTERRLDAAQMDALLERAERQSSALEELRVAAATRALDPRTTPTS